MDLTKKEFEQLKHGEPEIFKRLYYHYKDKLYNFFMLKSNRNIDLAEELLSDTFSSALTAVGTLKNMRNINGWIFQIAQRRFYDYLRKKYRDEKHIVEAEHEEIGTGDEIVEQIDRKTRALVMKTALDNLKPRYKEMITMKYLEEKSLKDIAAQLHITETAVKSVLKRARKALKNEMMNISTLFNSENSKV